MTESTAAALFARARAAFPDGTTRVTVEADPTPLYARRGEGAWLEDVEGRRWLDLHGNFTALIHGHGFPPVVEAVAKQLRDGTCFANPTAAEVALAELIRDRVPDLDHLRFVNSGTEAVMFAVKAARAFTGRPAIAKIEGAYHGSYDWVEVSQTSTPENWGPKAAPASIPYYAGMPSGVPADVVTLRLNDPDAAAHSIDQNAGRLAAILLDPMPSRAGLIPIEPAFVGAVTAAARRHGILLICDEVMNFRLGHSGGAPRSGLEPDLWTFGKIIGGGFPIGAIGGRKEVMKVFAKGGGGPAVPQGGTFSANPVSMVAGHAGMAALTPAAFERLADHGDTLRARLEASIAGHRLGLSVTGAASLLRIHARPDPPREYRETVAADRAVIARMVAHFAASDMLVPASGMLCLSTAMQAVDVARVAEAFEAFAQMEAGSSVGRCTF